MATASNRPRRFFIACMLVFTVMLVWKPPLASADEPIVARMGWKLLRGAANATLGLGELPKQLYLQLRIHPVAGLPLGVFDGVAMSVVRTGAGICEISTFVLPFPSDNAPLLKPEFVWERDRQGDRDSM